MKKQKKWIALGLVLAVTLIVAGCGNSGVSQEEYDKVVAERDELIQHQNRKEEIKNEESVGEWYENSLKRLEKEADEVKKKIETDYQNCISYIKNNVEEEKQHDMISYVNEIYEFYHDGIDYYINDYPDTAEEMKNTLSSKDLEESYNIDSVIFISQSIYTSENSFFTRIRELLPGYDENYHGYDGEQ